MTPPSRRRILALDGGGIRCLIAIEVLAALERQLALRSNDPGFRLCCHFDLVAGTSGGAIIAAALALGISMQEIRDFVVANARVMFRGARWYERLRSLYDNRELERNLRDWFGADTTLGSKRLRTLVMLVMSNWSTDSPWLVSNNPAASYNDRARDDCNLDLPLWQLARASAAAPVYYVPETIGFGPSQGYRFVFVDGGLTGFLNPAFKAFLYATAPSYRLNWPIGEQRITLLSIGSGEVRESRPNATAKDLGVIDAIKTMPGTLLYSSVREQDLLCRIFGRCITGDSIDTEIGDLKGSDGVASPPMFTYHRVNVSLSRAGLESIGCGHVSAEKVRPMDAADQVEVYSEIGRALAERRLGGYLADSSDASDARQPFELVKAEVSVHVMSRIFLSHSSVDELEAVAIKHWLTENGWDDIFLDVDAERGLVAGERWQAALRRAADRCEAVVFIISPAWAKSKWCLAEFLLAKSLHKLIFGIVIKEVPITELPTEMTAEWQLCQLIGLGPTETIRVTHRDKPAEAKFLVDGLKRLGSGLQSAGLAASYFAWPPKDDPSRAPYRGLEPLDVQDASIFFGRDVEILQGLDRLRGMRAAGDQSLFVILGASGAGKSSFLRAGLLSRLMRDDRHFFPLEAIRPERSPLFGERGLTQAIAKANGHLDLAPANSGEVKAAIREGVERLAALLRDIQCAVRDRLVDLPVDAPPPTLVLPIDQAEELFNADATEEARTFLGLIGAVLRSGLRDTASELCVPLIVVFTIRSDRYEPLQTASELVGLKTVVFDALRPMPTAQFKEVITGPASRATASNARLEVKPDLVRQLLADCAQGADTLPLLSLTLARLYRDYGSGGDLRLDAYQVMGGMTDVIQTEAESILDADPGTRNAQLHSLHAAFIPWLATINPANDQPMRRVAYMSDLPLPSRLLIDALIEKRLLLSDMRDGEQIVEVAHESLLRQWNALAKWLDQEREDLKEADRLEQAAAAWTKNKEKADWLIEGERLAGAQALVAKPAYSKRLEPVGKFLFASRDREMQRAEEKERQREAEIRGETERVAASRLRRRALQLTVAVVVALLMFFSAGYAFINANSERQKALLAQREANGLRLTAESLAIANGARAGGDERALLQVLAARKTAPNREVDAGLLGVLIATRNTQKLWIADAPINAVAFSPDGARVVSGGDNKMLRLWDSSTGLPIGAPMQGHTKAVTSVAFSSDGTHIVSGSTDATVRLWDAKSGMPLGSPLLGHSGAVRSVAFSPDGTRVASGADDKTLRLWDADTGRPVSVSLLGHDSLVIRVALVLEGDRTARIPNQLRHESVVTSVAFSPDGTRIVSGSSDLTVRLWDARNGKPIGAPLEGHTRSVLSVAFSPDGTRIVSGSLDKTLRLWDASTRQQIGAPLNGNENAVDSVAFSPDGKRIISGGWDKTLRLWDASTGSPIGAPMQTYDGRITSVAFSPDGTRIVSGGSDKMLRIWKGKPGESIGRPLGMHQDAVFMVSFSPDGTRIVSGSFDKSLQLWNATTGSPVGKRMRGHEEAVTSAAFNPDGSLIVSGSLDKTLRLWDAKSAQAIGKPLRGHEEGVYSVAFSPDGTRVVSGSSDGTLRLWDASTGQSTGTPMRWGQGTAYSVGYSPDGKRIASSFEKQTLQLWDTSTGSPAGPPMRGHKGSVTSVAFSPDGRRIVSSGDLTLRLWDAQSGQPIGEPMPGHRANVQSVAFSPDGTYLVSGGDDKTLRLWDASTGALIGGPMEGHRSTVFSVAFSPDGKQIVSGSEDKTVRLWPAPKIWPDELCGKVTRNMSHKEWDNWVSKDIPYLCQCPGLPIPQDDPTDVAKPEACSVGKS